ncbi:MAG: hypothetical protein ABI658_02035 [Acidimicrobiales bacterium]
MTVTRRSTRPSPRPQPREVDPEFTERVESWLSDAPATEVAPDVAPEVEVEFDEWDDDESTSREEDIPSRVSIGLVGTLAFIFVFGALFGLAAFHSVLVQNQLRIDRLSRDVEREQARYQDLRIEYGQAAAPFRILAQAGARGMLPSKSKQPLQAVLPEQGDLSAPNAKPFGNVANFVPPVVSAPPTEATPPQTTAPPATTPVNTAPVNTAPVNTAPAPSTAPTASTAPTTTKAVR